jgi:hypothetical protein
MLFCKRKYSMLDDIIIIKYLCKFLADITSKFHTTWESIAPITHKHVTRSYYQLHETDAYKSGSLQVHNIRTKFCEKSTKWLRSVAKHLSSDTFRV